MPPKKSPESTETIRTSDTEGQEIIKAVQEIPNTPRYTATQVKVNMLEGYINRLPQGQKLFSVVHVSGAYYLVITESE